MIWFNGKSSDDLHLYVERYPDRKLPERKTAFYSYAGRTGDYVYQQNAFSNYTQAYEIYISAEARRLPHAMLDVTSWLYGANGYAKLEDSYDLDSYRMACFVGGQDIANTLNKYGRATIEFNCKPQRWLQSGERLIDLTAARGFDNAVRVDNPTGIASKPYFEIEGTGSLSLNLFDTVQDIEHSFFYVSEVDGIVGADTETLSYDAPFVDDPYTQAGDLPKLDLVSGSIYYDGDNITTLKMRPRWFTL